LPFTLANQSGLTKFLPRPALEIFVKAANECEQAGLQYNDCIKGAWASLKEQGWSAPPTGKKWLFIAKDDPTSADVHVEAPLGSQKKPKKKTGDWSGDGDWTEKDDYEKYNETHDDHGRFASGGGSSGGLDTPKHQRLLAMAGTKTGAPLDLYPKEAGELNQAGLIHRSEVFTTGGNRTVRWLKKYADSYDKGSVATVFKVDDGLGLVFGWAIVCAKNGTEYFDTQGDHIPEDSMLSAAADFMENSRVGKDMHAGDKVGPVVFAWPMTADIAKAMGIQTTQTGLMVAMKPPPEILTKFRNGEYTGFSIGGRRVHDEEVE
jgi:hypothetical protein